MPLVRGDVNTHEARIEPVTADILGHPDESVLVPDIIRYCAQRRSGEMADGALLHAKSRVEPAQSQPDALCERITRLEEEFGRKAEEDRLGLEIQRLDVEAKVASEEPRTLERRTS